GAQGCRRAARGRRRRCRRLQGGRGRVAVVSEPVAYLARLVARDSNRRRHARGNMADPDPLIVERPSEAVVLLRLNRPERRNALNVPLRKRIAEAVTESVADPKVRAIVMTGNEQAFAAGADIGEMADAGPIDIMVRNVQQYYRVVAECPKPVIVAIEGFAL